MTTKKTLGRGLAAIATIGAIGLGSLLAAAPASADDRAIYKPEFVPVTAGQEGVPTYVEWITDAPLTNGETLRLEIGGGATWDVPRVDPVIVDAASSRVLGVHYEPCERSAGDTVMTCTVVVSDIGYMETLELRLWERVSFPAGARPGDTFPITLTTSTAEGVQTGHGTKTPYIADIEEIVVVTPGDQSVIAPAGQQFTGTSHPGAAVVVTDATGNVLGAGTADAQGTWTITVDATFEVGTVELTFTETAPDALGADIEKSTTGSFVVIEEEEGEGVPVMSLTAGLGAGALTLAGLGAFAIRRRADQA